MTGIDNYIIISEYVKEIGLAMSCGGNISILFLFAREIYKVHYEGKEVAVMSYGGGSRHLKWRHIRTKTEQLSGRNKNCIRLHLFFLREIYNPYYEERTRDAGSQRIRKYIHAYGVAIW